MRGRLRALELHKCALSMDIDDVIFYVYDFGQTYSILHVSFYPSTKWDENHLTQRLS